jgi:methionyl-tRNA formyltransferase
MKKMRIGYFADGPWSHNALDAILKDKTLEIVFICARFDTQDKVLRTKAMHHGIQFVVHPNINSKEFMDFLLGACCDLFVSMSFNQIFKNDVINIPKEKTINCHAGKLPFYRGRNVLNWALINDEKDFGVTVHYVDDGIDTGDIILQRCYPITDDDDYSTLLNRSYSYCAEILVDAIKIIQSGVVKRIRQDSIHPVGFYCPQRKLGDESLDWSLTSREVFNFVRAISKPGPEARTFIDEVEVRINHVELISGVPTYKATPGAILKKGVDYLLVKTGDSFVKVTEWSSNSKLKIGDRLT